MPCAKRKQKDSKFGNFLSIVQWWQMIIKNFNSLATNRQKKDALSIIEMGLQASMPGKTLQKIIHKDHILVGQKKISIKKYRRVFVVAIGKAADSMTKEVNSVTLLDGGIV